MARKKTVVVETAQGKTERKRILLERSAMYEIQGRESENSPWKALANSSKPFGIADLYPVIVSLKSKDCADFRIVKIAVCELANGQASDY